MSVNKWELEETLLELIEWYKQDLEDYLRDRDECSEFAEKMFDIRERIKEDQKHRLQTWNGLNGR